jgi:hypothetical protein
MASTTEMSFPSFRPTLAHTYNSRGELGMFVNPYACSCVTCEDYKTSYSSPLPTPTPASLTTLPPPRSIQEVTAAEALVDLYRSAMFSPSALERTVTGFHYSPPEDDGIGPTASIASTGTLLPSPSPAPRPSPTGGLGLSSSSYGAVRFWTEEEKEDDDTTSVKFSSDQIATLKESLKDYYEVLTERQNGLDHSNCRSHDEMAAQDQEWDEIDRKITEIDEILAVLEEA